MHAYAETILYNHIATYLHDSPIASKVTLISAAKSSSVSRLPGARVFMGRKK